VTPLDLSGVAGMAELLGRGVYTTMPEDVPDVLRGQHAVVVGEPATSAAAALQLSGCGCGVTLVTREPARSAGIPCELRRALRGRANIRMRHRTELAWAVGITHLEAVVLRRVTTGRIEAWNAAALFVLLSRSTTS
jgi:thioredoxin reductase